MLKILNQTVRIDWPNFKVGTSIFIPCLDRDEVEKFVISECRRMQFEVHTKKVIRRSIYGLQVWRVG